MLSIHSDQIVHMIKKVKKKITKIKREKEAKKIRSLTMSIKQVLQRGGFLMISLEVFLTANPDMSCGNVYPEFFLKMILLKKRKEAFRIT